MLDDGSPVLHEKLEYLSKELLSQTVLCILLEMCVGCPMSQLLLELPSHLYRPKVKASLAENMKTLAPGPPLGLVEFFNLSLGLVSSGWGFDHKKLQMRQFSS